MGQLEVGDGGDLVVERREAAVTVAIAAAEEVKGHSCWKCGRVFSTGAALGGHTSSGHGALKKLQYSTEGTKISKDSQMGKFTCDHCGKGFPSLKGLHGHMRLHPAARDRRGATKPPPPQILAADSEQYDPPNTVQILETEDSIKSTLWPPRAAVTGKRGRRGTKPHLVDTPETYLAKKKALLSGDPRELKKIIDHHDPTGYFRRAFGNFLDYPLPEKERDVLQEDSEGMEKNYSDENMATSSSSSYYCSNSSEKSDVADDSTSKEDRTTCEKSVAMEGTASTENMRLTGMKRKTMDSTM